jgi:hypothetical protein
VRAQAETSHAVVAPTTKAHKTEPTKARPAPAANLAAPKETGDKEFDRLTRAWLDVVTELSSVSNSASQRLPKSRVREQLKSGAVVIEFERMSDAEWVQEGTKIRKAVMESWYKHSGGQQELKFEGSRTNGTKPASPETTTVELPAEGESLQKLGQEVFGSGDGS